MANIEWDVAHTLLTPYVNVALNGVSAGHRFLIESEGYKIVPSLRVTQDNISQADGSVLHPRWKTGLVAQLKVIYWINDFANSAEGEPACGKDLRLMHEALVGALNSITSLTTSLQRLKWQPTGYADMRMLEDIQLLSWPDPAYDLNGLEASVTFQVESPFPYAMDVTLTTTPMGGSSGHAFCDNLGNAPYSPVVHVLGPCVSGFTLTNQFDTDDLGNPLKVVYDTSRPGSLVIPNGDYAIVDFFQGTCVMGSSGANLIAGIDPTLTDFWHLQPHNLIAGPNEIILTGDAPSASILWRNAWA